MFAISGLSTRALQLEPHPVEPVAGVVCHQSLQRHEVEDLPVALTREDQPLRLLGGRAGQIEVGGEERVLAAREEDVGVVEPAVGRETVERGRRRLEVARHHRAAREPDPQRARRVRLGAVEGFAVRRHGHRIADRVEQIAAQRQRDRPVGAGRVRAHRVNERERVPVRADGRFRLRGAQEVRDRFGRGT